MHRAERGYKPDWKLMKEQDLSVAFQVLGAGGDHHLEAWESKGDALAWFVQATFVVSRVWGPASSKEPLAPKCHNSKDSRQKGQESKRQPCYKPHGSSCSKPAALGRVETGSLLTLALRKWGLRRMNPSGPN